jgi:pyridoxine 4-dehydrogenase
VAPVGRPEYLRQQLELSLRRLRVERIDLYQLHRIDPRVSMEETLGAVRDFVSEGKVRHVGLSEVTPAEIEQAQRILPVVTVQNRYNLSDREHEPALDYCERNGIGFIP